MSAVLRFVAWVITQAWRYGKGIVQKVADWARKNWRKVYQWIVQGVVWETIVGWIKRILGID